MPHQAADPGDPWAFSARCRNLEIALSGCRRSPRPHCGRATGCREVQVARRCSFRCRAIGQTSPTNDNHHGFALYGWVPPGTRFRTRALCLSRRFASKAKARKFLVSFGVLPIYRVFAGASEISVNVQRTKDAIKKNGVGRAWLVLRVPAE